MNAHICTKDDFLWERVNGLDVAVRYIAPYSDIVIDHVLVSWGPGGIFSRGCFDAQQNLESILIRNDIAYKVRFLKDNASCGFLLSKRLRRIENLPPANYLRAFQGCTSLEFVSFVQRPCPDVSNAFSGCTSLQTVVGLDIQSRGYDTAFEGLSRMPELLYTH